MKATEPCRVGWESADPGAGSFTPNPCVRCGWSAEDHAHFDTIRDLKNEILIAVNEALEPYGFGISRGHIDGEDVYHALKLPKVAAQARDDAARQKEDEMTHMDEQRHGVASEQATASSNEKASSE